MSIGVQNMGQVKNPRLDEALKELAEIRKRELEYEKAKGDAEKWYCLEDLCHGHMSFIIDWATRNAIGLALKGLIERDAGILRRSFTRELTGGVEKGRGFIIKNCFETVSTLARSAGHAVHEQIDSIKKTREEIQAKIEALQDELAAIRFIESRIHE